MNYLASLVLIIVFAQQNFAQQVFVAAATNLSEVLSEISAEFEKTTGHRVYLSLASSGNLIAQINAGAPFDVFLSADMDYPRELEKFGLTEPDSLFVYAIGRLVVWSRDPSNFHRSNSWLDLLLQSSGPIALANPRHAPYGRVSKFVLEEYEIWDMLVHRIVFGQNVAQFVQSGAAKVGLIPLSLALSKVMKETGSHWELPITSQSTIRQGGVILKGARGAGRFPAAKEFVDFVRGQRGREILADWGFTLPVLEALP